MSRKNLPHLAWITAAMLPLVAGCATKGYVNKQIEPLRTEQVALRNSTEDALARARTASDAADEARDLALGRAGLEELNRYTVFFAFDSDEIRDEERSTLDHAADEINSHPEAIIDVYGFADPTGPDRYNLDLGQRRAMEVVRFLVSAAPNNLSKYAAVSYGERAYPAMTADAQDNEHSRRVVISLIRRIPLGEQTPPSAELLH